ncbi:hypothetical protein GCM10007079_48600 [Nocardiopsis terrae]|uniref:Immunity protein Imm1 n=1 Tax=Nocardiopsis terrae TaxID=372655 RepID=A0ABR9HAJ3_9ACTN|nr:hypothetical protein [Nocardiopsis terrae]MBE1456023.1 hypothetical protein [Nocardiopsis terrae]GHC96240.1 hypothetical protein GCM10007079_48600 [Nocardiopsis terrae]
MAYQFEDNTTTEVVFDIRIPEDWTHYDLSADGLAELRSNLLGVAAQNPGDSAQVEDFFVELASLSQNFTDSGMLSAAGVMKLYEDGPFMASIALFRFTSPKSHDMDPLKMIDHLHSSGATESEGTWLEKTVVELPDSGADSCARAQGVTDYEYSPDVTLRSVVMYTAFRVPGSRARLLIACSSPNVREQGEVLNLFDAITGTSRFWHRAPVPEM